MATEAQIRNAFLSGVRSIVDASKYGALRDAIARGDYLGALDAVDIDEAAFDDMRRLILETYAQGGIDAQRGTRWPVPVRWNSATPQAEYFARSVVGQNITWITNDMRDAVRATMGDGIALGRSNRQIALDIVGRMGPSGNRSGGILGLNRQQAGWVNGYINPRTGNYVQGYRDKLRLGLPIGNTLVTPAERRLIDKGNLTEAQISRLVQSYNNRLLLSRGLTIARTERGIAINMGAMEGYRQAAARAGIPLNSLRKTWRHEGHNQVDRLAHLSLAYAPSRPFNEPFYSNGFPCQFPHDPMLPASEVVNCGCRIHVSVPRNWRQVVG